MKYEIREKVIVGPKQFSCLLYVVMSVIKYLIVWCWETIDTFKLKSRIVFTVDCTAGGCLLIPFVAAQERPIRLAANSTSASVKKRS